MVIVYTKPGCQPCRLTKNQLAARNVSFVAKDVVEDPTALEEVKALGYLQVPVVHDTTTGEHWYGLQPARLNELALQAA